MLHDIIQKGSTDRSVRVRIADSTDGTPETGVVWNTSGIDLWYRREGQAKVAITEATLAALTTAHSDGGFLHIADGVYRLDLPDAAFATGANYVEFGGTVTGMVVYGGVVKLVNYNPEDSVRLGLTALPNAAADAAGGLPISDAGALDLDAVLSGNTPQTGDSYARLGAPAGASIAADVAAANTDTDTILTRLVGTIAAGTHNPQSGDAFARLGAPVGASISADVATVDGIVDTLLTRLVGTIAAGTHNAQSGDSFARLGAPAGASVSADIAALNDLSTADLDTAIDAALDETMADSIPADGTRPSLRQAMYMVVQYLLERAASGTTVTVYKVDGVTSLFTLTLDSATSPTSVTRAT